MKVYRRLISAMIWHEGSSPFRVGVGSYYEIYKIRNGEPKLIGWSYS